MLTLLMAAGLILVPTSAFAAPINDDFPGTTITGPSGSIAGTTIDATGQLDENVEEGHATVWYSWTAPGSGEVELSTCEADFNTYIQVFIGDTVATAIDEVEEEDDECEEGEGTFLTFEAVQETTYRFQVSTLEGTEDGNFTLTWFIDLPDDIDPTITITTPPNGATYTQDQVVNADYSCADTGGSGLASCSGPVADGSPIDTSTLGSHSFTVNASDNVGNTNTLTHTYTVSPVPDTIDPTITITTPPNGATYTQGQVVNADYSCADTGGSGLASCSGPVADGSPIDTSTTGPHTFTVNASDNAGNTNSRTTNYTVGPPPDTIPPTITITTPAEGAFYRGGSTVLADFACSDAGGSGLATCVGTVADGSPIDTSTGGPHTFSVTATDVAGNDATKTVTYKVDFTPPVVTITTPPNGAVYNVNQVVNAAFTCTDESGGSGLASCVGPVANGSAIDTSTAGAHSFTVTGTDNVGNVTTVTNTYTVASADLSVVKECPDVVIPGSTYTCTLTIANAGPSAAANVVVSDTLPAGVTLASTPSGGGFTCTGAVGATSFSCTKASQPYPGSPSVISYTASIADTVGPGVTLNNNATVSSSTFDPNTANNSDIEPVSTPTCTIFAGGGKAGGTSGNDVICGSSGVDNISAGAGDDIIFGGGGADDITGMAGNDTILGGSGADRLTGGDGNDRILGGAGDDTMTGGSGTDYGDGGPGADRCTTFESGIC